MEALYADQDRHRWTVGGAILVGICLGFAGLVGRLVYINTALAPDLNALVRAQQVSGRSLPARRGSVLDASGRIVAGTRHRPSVFADPELISDLDEAAQRLSVALGLPEADVSRRLHESSSRRFCWIARLVEPEDARAVRALKLRGVGIRDESDRYHPMGGLMRETLGIVGRDGRGLEGIELVYDDHLRGVDGRRVSVYDGRKHRRAIGARRPLSRPERDGGHVMLTIDTVIQASLQENLREAVESFEAEKGVGIVMFPNTGDILAIGQYLALDSEGRPLDGGGLRRHRAICDAVEPGSTFKPFVACGALMAGVVDPDEQIDCGKGVHSFNGRVMHDSSPHGQLTFEGVIAKSSNIGMGIIAGRMGNEAIYKTVRSFGFGARLGLRFPGEATGMVLPLQRWTDFSTRSVPIGHEVTATALQLATAFCAIVNGGELLRPRLVRALLDSDSRVVRSFDGPEVIRRVMPRDIARYMTERVLVGVVKNGGGRAAALSDWQVLGKTGTAQVPYGDERGYEDGAYIGSFIGAAPAEDPACVVLVMIHRPDVKLGYYGTTVAAPAVRSILADTLSYLGVSPSSRVSGM